MTQAAEIDEIVRDITIRATPELVFSLASTPGWWINDGEIVDHKIDTDDQGRSVVHDPTHGAFVFETVDSRVPEYVAFRWLIDPDADLGTLVEFTITDLGDGSVRLHVRESGFATLALDAQERRQRVEGNTKGWRLELTALAALAGRTEAETA